jgi:hypothetical protein
MIRTTLTIGPRTGFWTNGEAAIWMRRIGAHVYHFYATPDFVQVSYTYQGAAADEVHRVPRPVVTGLSAAERAARALHATCDRVTCDGCDDQFDECEARYRDQFDAFLCGDCHAGRADQAEAEAAWRAYQYA